MAEAAAARVVIVGGGFGGLYAARALSRVPVQITLLDRKNHHTFQPLLYQVATAGLTPSDIATPLRNILRRQENVTVLLAEAERIDVPGKRVVLEDGEAISYDHLIVATGATHSYFGHPEWAHFAPGLKSVDIARTLRGEARRPFRYQNPGMLATIGRGAGVAEVGKLRLSGFIAWAAWLSVHLLFLIGFRNRFAVLAEWAVAYLTYDRGARLITGKLPAWAKEAPPAANARAPGPG
jgi:NADH dehydrogenase FAD-containing subunit